MHKWFYCVIVKLYMLVQLCWDPGSDHASNRHLDGIFTLCTVKGGVQGSHLDNVGKTSHQTEFYESCTTLEP